MTDSTVSKQSFYS